MPIEKWSESVAVVHLADDPQFSEELEAAARLGPPCLNRVLDFSAVHFVTSSNIAALLTLRKHIHGQNGKLVLCNLANQILSTFLVTGLVRFSSSAKTFRPHWRRSKWMEGKAHRHGGTEARRHQPMPQIVANAPGNFYLGRGTSIRNR